MIRSLSIGFAKPRICLETGRTSCTNIFRISAKNTRENHILSNVMASSAGSRGRGGRVRGAGGDRPLTRKNVIVLEKETILNMDIKEKRKLYRCGSNYVELDSIPTWTKMQTKFKQGKEHNFSPRPELNRKVSVWKGDITKLEIDAISNAANNSLLGGGGVDGAIHASAGSGLRLECATLNGCDTGDAKITGGYNLPARYVIHTVGPIGERQNKLRECYSTCLKLLKENDLRSLAFPCISTGIFGYPNKPAAHVALETVRTWLETDKNHERVDRIIFCMFQPNDLAIYEELMQSYFPPGEAPVGEEEKEEEEEAVVAASETQVKPDQESKPSESETPEKNETVEQKVDGEEEASAEKQEVSPQQDSQAEESEKKT